MNTLLHIDSSANPRGSVSHKLTAEFTAAWRASRAGEKVIYRDLDRSPVPSISHQLTSALGAAPGVILSEEQKRALTVSNILVNELFDADAYVFGVPMYNFSIPGVFKDYIDQVARRDRGVIPETGRVGKLAAKKVIVIATRARGPVHDGADGDFHEPYLRKVFGYFGVADFTYVPVIQEAASAAPEIQAAHLETARARLRETLARWNAETAQAAHPVHEARPKVAA
jgi:FMN-dependent NADH-azoreductase